MHLADFPDRLSPMLVKELRQGLRTRAFIAVFLTLQIVLGIILLSAGATASSDDAGSTISNIIFIFFSIAVLIIQPMRGISALSSEIKGNTIDMMVLTRLSAWRIVTGKWSAIVSQSALILVTIIPYLILRYFFGGMNLLGEIVLLALIFITSAALTAVTVGLSASSSAILRSVLPMIAIPIAAYSLLVTMMFGAFGGGGIADLCSLETKDSRIAVSIYLAICWYGGYYFLSIGTSLIAPYAENHSTGRRLVALAVTLVVATLASIPSITDPDALPILFFAVLAPPFAISLTEFSMLVPPVYRKFSKYGPPGRIAALFFSPGWPQGAFFCTLLTAIATVPFVLNKPAYGGSDHYTYGLSAIATLLFPALLVALIKNKGPVRVSNYLLFGVASGIVSLVLMGVAESLSNRDFMWLFVWIPPVIALMKGNGRLDDQALLVAAVAVTLIMAGLLLVMAFTTYRATLKSIASSDT